MAASMAASTAGPSVESSSGLSANASVPDSANSANGGNDVWPLVELYSDGACSGNPGKGGWAYILRHLSTGIEKEASGAERETTNNRMELLAVIRGLEALRRPCRVHLFTDSKYVGQGLTEWLPNWKARGWKRGKDPVKNVELWQQLDALASRHKLRFTHVRGHSGHPENERCDQLAVAAYQNLR
ncbi:MAG: Ribonuclease [Planctomycetota bacterium]|jgi:ribonuclease HI